MNGFACAGLAADQNYALAQHNLGVCFAQGTGVKQSLSEAAKFYRLAAEQGYSWSQHNLGNAYNKGRGVDRDLVEGAKWFRRAAEQGIAESQLAYGLCCASGRQGTPRDMKEAVIWLTKAVEQGNPGAQAVLGRIYFEGTGGERNVELGVKLIRTSAETGYVMGEQFYGVMYAKGLGAPKDLIEAYKWYTLALRQGDERSREFREQLGAGMSPEQIADATKRADKFKPIASTEKDSDKKFFLKMPSKPSLP